MKQLNEFETVQAARDYIHTTYRKIGGNEARQIFSMMGALKPLREAQQSEEPCVINEELGMTTTVGELAEAALATISKGQFATDPNTEDGQLNIGASLFLVQAGVYPMNVHQAFFARARSKDEDSKPFASVSEYEWRKARGETIDKKQVTPTEGYLDVVTNADTESHRPCVFAMVASEYRRITTLPEITTAGKYSCPVPTKYATLYVDDHYRVIA